MIRLTNVHKSYGQIAVLTGVNLEVSRGEVCALLGPSGSGKSTLLRTMNGLESIDEGVIEVGQFRLPAGVDAGRAKALAGIRRMVGMVFQQFHLFPHMTVLQNIIEAPIHVLQQPREQTIQFARQLLDRVGLLDKCDARPASLSGGQQQRVAIARTLAMSPEVILFDEPTSALDPQMAAEVTAVINDLVRSGQTMVIVTHSISFARNSAHRVHILHGGNVIESGRTLEVLNAPQHPVTVDFLKAAMW